jgi:hypothetical protein
VEKIGLWKRAQEELKQEDAIRKIFLAALKVLENPKADKEKKQLARKMIREFLRFRAVTTKALRVITGEALL